MRSPGINGEGELRGNWLTQVHLEKWPLKWSVCVAEERPLKDHERPLVVQLNWGVDDREGRFLLKKETDPTLLV